MLDPPRGEEEWTPVDDRFAHAVDLVSYIRSTPEFADSFCIGVAGHLDSSFGVSSYSRDPNLHVILFLQLTQMDIPTMNTQKMRRSII